MYKESNRLFDDIFLRVLKRRNLIGDIQIPDFDVTFVRNSMNNILIKSQAALNMKNLGFSPELAFAKSGLSNDPISDVEASKKYIDIAWGQAQKSTLNEVNTQERVSESYSEANAVD